MPSDAQLPEITYRITLLGRTQAQLSEPPLTCDKFGLVEKDAVEVDLAFIVLLDQQPETLEQLFARLAEQSARHVIVSVVHADPHPLIVQRAGRLGGVVRCTPEIVWAPMAHLLLAGGLIGIDLADTLGIMRGRIGRVWRGQADHVMEPLDRTEVEAASVAFSVDLDLIRVDHHAQAAWRCDIAAMTVQMNDSIAEPNLAEMLLMRSPDPLNDRMAALLPTERYAAYRTFARARGYTDPCTPLVGDSYGDGLLPRIVYCGAAARWNEMERNEGDDETLRLKAADWYADFALAGGGRGRFWTLFHAMLAAVDPEPSRPRQERTRRAAWTNLSKLGLPGESAPPNSDGELRSKDLAQMRHELDLLKPEILVCVSGSMLTETGYALFNQLAPGPDLFAPLNPSSWARTLTTGGKLYWTMHPGYKSDQWMANAVDDIARLART